MSRLAAIVVLALLLIIAVAACGGGENGRGGSAPTGSQLPLAFVRDGDIWMVNADGADERRLTDWGDVQDFDWAPGGGIMVALRRSNIRALGPGEERCYGPYCVRCYEPHCDPFLWPWPYYEATVITLEGETVLEIPPVRFPYLSPDAHFARWSPKGDLLAYAAGSSVWKIVDLQGKEVLELSGSAPVWSPDETKVAYGRIVDGDCGELCTTPVVLDLVDGSVWEVDSLSRSAGSVAFSPDGLWLSCESTLVNVATREKRPLPGLPVSWSPDSRYLALFQGAHLGGVAIYEVERSEVACQRVSFMPPIYADRASAFGGKWSSDGRWFVFPQRYYEKNAGIRKTLAAAEVDTCQTHGIKSIELEASAEVELEISTDGRHIAYTRGVSTWAMGINGSLMPMWVVGMDGTALTELGTGLHPRWQAVPIP
ncbi:MAG: hypothetical protein A2Y74_01800 [Actinobacteria bacterium RBG_13_63_9]|nr:MAG: hypothetical protein A2Y74_01800 [Actinobacteria bacterium RBG_13_63_9]